MGELEAFLKKHPDFILLEDTCESLGSYYYSSLPAGQHIRSSQAEELHADPGPPQKVKKMLGTTGDFGTYSFYFSHHITSGEGGMVVCHSEEDYNFLRSIRAHGWTRHMTPGFKDKIEEQYPDIDSRFLFIHKGYNLRPLEIQGAMLQVQLKKLHLFNQQRRDNYERIKLSLQHLSNRFRLMEAADGCDPAWFGIAILLLRSLAHQKTELLAYLDRQGIENRPIISGNFLRQPLLGDIQGHLPDVSSFVGAEIIHEQGFFIGIHQVQLSEKLLFHLVSTFENFDFAPRDKITVFGDESKDTKEIGRKISGALDLSLEDSEFDFLPSLLNLDNKACVTREIRRTKPTAIALLLHNTKNSIWDEIYVITAAANLLDVAYMHKKWFGWVVL